MNNYKAPYKFHSSYWTYDSLGKKGERYGFNIIDFTNNKGMQRISSSESDYYKECKLDIIYSSMVAIRNKFAETAVQMINNMDGFKVIGLLAQIYTTDNNDKKEFVWKLQK